MRVMKHVLAALVAAALVVPGTAASQQARVVGLDDGRWTGNIIPPGGDGFDVTFDVVVKDGAWFILIDAGQFGTFPTSEVEFSGTILSFVFMPGPRVHCALKKKTDGSYSGGCTDDGGTAGHVTMVPPAKKS